MDRRSAIKNITLSFGTITLSTGTMSIIQSCQTNTADWNPKFFSLSDLQFLEKVLENISFNAPDLKGKKVVIDAKLVDEHVGSLSKAADLRKYVL